MTTFILLHGSFHAAWNWHRVVPILRERGQSALAIDLPAHGRDGQSARRASLSANVTRVCEAIDTTEGDVVLVAHSRMGIVISQVAEQRSRRISGLVYLAAYLVPNEKTMMDYAVLDKESLVVRNVTPVLPRWALNALLRYARRGAIRRLLAFALPTSAQRHALKPEVYREALYHDCGEEITELANVLLEPEPNWPGFTPLRLSDGRYGRVPKVYIECTQDRAVTPKLQRMMLRDTPCDRVFSMATSHSPFFSQPDRLVELLLESLRVFADVRASKAPGARPSQQVSLGHGSRTSLHLDDLARSARSGNA
jgi:pimeloyl-ACP methyl ester carboxylesterase